MSGKKQKASSPDQPKAITCALGILTAIVALAVSAAPVASAGQATKQPPRATRIAIHEYGHVNHINASGGWDPTLRTGKTALAAVLYDGHAGLGANAKA